MAEMDSSIAALPKKGFSASWERLSSRYHPLLLLGCGWLILLVVGSLVVRMTETTLGSVEHRLDFHRRQMDFKARCELNRVVGRPVENVYRYFGGEPSILFHGEDWECHWKDWPCELVVRDGVVRGVFYHDYPYSMQPLPENHETTHSLPYFERFPQYVTETWIWDNSDWRFEPDE
jgi:hypothetical protein